jgi:flagellar basal body-associated protein FliL
MWKLIFTLLLLLAGYVAYMYFFGKGEDKSSAESIVRETRDVVNSVGDFLKHQKDKYDDGEFDRMIEKVEKSIHKLKSTSSENQDEVKKTLRELELELKKIDPEKLSEENKKQLKKIQDELNEELNEIISRRDAEAQRKIQFAAISENQWLEIEILTQRRNCLIVKIRALGPLTNPNLSQRSTKIFPLVLKGASV